MYQPQSGPSARSPPPLHHPVPKHPKVSVPEPPVTPGYAPGARSSAGPYAGGNPAAYAGGSGAAPRASVSQMNPGYQRINSPTYTSAADPYGYGADASARSAPGVGMQSMGSMYAAQGGAYDGAAAAGYASPGFPPGYGAASEMASPNGLPHMGSRGAGAGSESQWGAGGMPFASGGMMNDATAQMGVQFGRHVAQVGGEYMQRNVRSSPTAAFTDRCSSARFCRCRSSSTTSTCRTRTSCTSCASSCSPGVTAHGPVGCGTRPRTARAPCRPADRAPPPRTAWRPPRA